MHWFLWFLFVSALIQYVPTGYCYVLPPHRLSDSLQTFYLKEEYQNIFREKYLSKNKVFLEILSRQFRFHGDWLHFPLQIIFKLLKNLRIFSSLEITIAFVAFSSSYNTIIACIWHVWSFEIKSTVIMIWKRLEVQMVELRMTEIYGLEFILGTSSI